MQYTTSSSCGSGVDDGQCDGGEFKLETAPASQWLQKQQWQRNEVQRVRPLLSELQVPKWQELAAMRAGVGRRKWRKVLESTGDIV
jgi:hypothetical protein